MAEVPIIREEEKQLIQRAYRQLLRSIKSDMDEQDQRNIRLAYEMAVDAHSKQRRKSGEPYILHPIEVARICAEEIGLGPTAVVCALLHDVVEDTDVTLGEIGQKFGERIARIVDGLTKLDGSYNKDTNQAENFKKVLSTLVDDVRVVLIKMADRLHNMRTLGSMPRHKQLKIAAETSYIYAPLAHRLGLHAVKTEFQDLCFRITEPEAYAELSQRLQETRRERTRYINEFIRPLTTKLDEIGAPYRIFGRPKAISSVWSKIRFKLVSFEEIYDLFAVRIVVDVEPIREKALCWHVYSVVTDVYKPIPERLKDWITTPKSNGYESLHTTVIGPKGRFVEVQIRTERMDAIAERGFAAHWKYKGVNNQADVYETWLEGIRELLENPNSDALEFISDFKTNLFSEELYVYTPKGDMKVLPKGATALDFAFSIHSDVGYHCTGVKVNGRLVPMGYELKNGDQVSVMTNRAQKPNEGWLKMVVTGKAKSKIRSSMKEERREQGMIGREHLERKLKNMKADFEPAVEFLVKHYGFASHIDFYYAISTEAFNVREELKQFRVEAGRLHEHLPELKPVPVVEEPDQLLVKPKKDFTGKTRILVGGEPADQYNYSFASCCNPLPGDDIFAFLSQAAGLKIHRTSCPNAVHLMANYGYRIMKAEWVSSPDSTFVADLKITGIDDGPGIIERLTHEISTKLGVNIRSFNIHGDEGYFEGKVSLFIANTDQLNMAIRTLKNLRNVSTVTRVE
ncbi:MAG: bifunctional (p)ppGpp synthetase/guanosine-3',5'-bis(diphosphate) 3'-pyrophosphohydrolase [Saprospirales bacterium]|nr:bifunctional (p)ppGpp synthetase/guanosine-3',5'-bis(diphosphate) 3'-pyrophosphohydrolase [Saprospirales bacterium]